MATVRCSPELAAIVGTDPLTRTEIVSRLWEYIKTNELQDPEDKRRIRADAGLARIFGQDSISMFEINRVLNDHID